MVAILNSAMFKSTILDSGILVFPLKITHTCQDWMPPFAQKKLHSFILTQLDDGSHLEFVPSWIHPSELYPLKLTHTCKDWFPPFAQKELHSFILIQLDEGGHLEFCHFAETKLHLIHSHSTCWWQSSWIQKLPSWIQTHCCTSLKLSFIHCHSTLTLTGKLSWILPCNWILTLPSSIQPTLLSSLRFTAKTPSLHSDSNWLKLIQSDRNSWWHSHLELCHDGFSHLEFCHVQTHTHLAKFRHPSICTKKKLHSFTLTQDWWCQLSCRFQKLHSWPSLTQPS